jgi:hypothetical protein
MRKGATVSQLNATITELMDSRGQGGDFQVETNEFERVDPNMEYLVEDRPARRISIFLKQTKIEVGEDESWLNVSDRIADSMGN